MTEQLAGMRVDYRSGGFDVGDLAPTWHEQLAGWLAAAQADGILEANAMVLATAGPDGRPASRTVLCKGLDERGVVFYTNYTSAKSHDLRATRYASATFPWYAQHRQAHVRGTVEAVTAAETLAYWQTRPRGSQLGAWASAQSVRVRDRRVLDDALAGVTQRFGDDPVPVPPHWGGWRIVPDQVEFWQGRTNRMHDRLRFEADRDRRWTVRRLAP
ncbi:pyridoxamine 5'-phosphate oxidase [Pseudonocardia sp. KRD-184]|uniref:Pyridoxine/pyridoxamine 5'-phosphate oxidase n=1 Tax=Pseudonocardia oceani TaxID=2792013 RepID=A0ABS6UAZ6_9PSEU|nr:pyridoxamine 5'-phosphate oxidase [Pseudonocardia oceani]MBW0091977.1 pyridoxamine 5'-phosphate oxidase [Pseudonocardia oceani]MBW0097408.1 pyridoxamine 5'-phosphate oxidase [Pseudonocardia oceani]MBW0111559.1 pyridoxamine 5'-phosphate oxidase [Pseudonocardia oceani]MBW0124145.1 pyridoxamine 5'-phosphate oxidase [Pseudonocardia oceani]MBW0129400.1 pyridoxamine 5'-phosphate oxidase [Pseudonocardia oceani]